MDLMAPFSFGLFWFLGTFMFARPEPSLNDKLLQTIEKYMDVTENPCDDFFSYACGKWSEQHENNNQRYTESTTLVDHKINKRLVNLLENYNFRENAIKDKVWTYYKSCRRGRRRISKRYLKIVKPGKELNWPLLESRKHRWRAALRNRPDAKVVKWAKAKKFNWLTTAATLRRYGLKNSLIEHLVLPKSTNSAEYLIYLDMPGIIDTLQLPYDYSMLAPIMVYLGVEESVSVSWSKKLKSFKKALNGLKESLANQGEGDGDGDGEGESDGENDGEPMDLKLKDIQVLIPDWPWQQYFEIILEREISEDFTFNLRRPSYFIALASFLNKTDPELLCNFLMLEFIFYLDMDKSSSPDKIDCMIDLRSKMDLAMNFIYVEEFFKQHVQIYNADVQWIIEIIRAEFHRKIDANINDLKAEELEYLKSKLNDMKLIMGNLPKDVDEEFVEKYYANIELYPKNYYSNHLSLLELRFRREHDTILHGRPELNDFFYVAESDTARSSTPFYLIRENLIIVPYGLLQTPIYHHHMHDVLKFSVLGFNLAHEIAHGFDESGVYFDRMGSLNEIGINITENDKFSAALSCMQRDETSSLDERIADIVGVRLAYDAVFDDANENGVAQNLTFNGKNVKEIFFLNLAQFFCGNLAGQFLDHDSDNVRLQEILMNFESFAETFHCNLETTMNPKQKCRLW